MTLNQILLGSLIYLAATVISAPLAKRLGLGSVLGFLVAGAIIGPSMLGIIGTQDETVKDFSEFGITMMLFLAGLELELDKVRQMRSQMFLLGTLQVVATTALFTLSLTWWLGDWREALSIGFIFALSSTAIVLQSMDEKGILKTPVGQSIFATLVFQDISVIPMFVLLPLLAKSGAGATDTSMLAGQPVLIRTAAVIFAVAAVLLAGRYVMRPLFRIVAATGLREIFVALALLIVVGTALLMGLVGLSASLGAFLAGVVLADSEYRHELDMDLQPFKGLLLAIFFIAVGAGIDFSVFREMPLLLLASVLLVIAAKYAVQVLVGGMFGMNVPDRLRYAGYLAQGSEFGFVMVSFCAGLGLLSVHAAAFLVSIITLTMALAPVLMLLDEKVIQPRFSQGVDQRAADAIVNDGADVIIAGHGRFGMSVGRILNGQGIKTVVLDFDSSQVDALRKFGFKVFYGDALRLDLLEAAGAKHAKLLIIAIDDRDRATELVTIARQNFPNLELFVRTFDRVHARDLLQQGVTHVYREVFGSSMDMAQDSLMALGRSKKDASRIIALFREVDERYLRKQSEPGLDDARRLDLARESRDEVARVFANDRAQAESAQANSGAKK